MPFQNLYFIAIIPPDAVCEEVTAFREDFAQNYNSSKALRVVPHITLKAPFKVDSVQHDKLMDWFKHIPVSIHPFQIELKDFGSFDNRNNPVIFVNPVVNDSLEELQKNVIAAFENTYPDIPVSFIEKNFHPHMTIAYRDLEREQYEKAWEIYKGKSYKAYFECNSFFLLQHDTKQWNVIAQHNLK